VEEDLRKKNISVLVKVGRGVRSQSIKEKRESAPRNGLEWGLRISPRGGDEIQGGPCSLHPGLAAIKT